VGRPGDVPIRQALRHASAATGSAVRKTHTPAARAAGTEKPWVKPARLATAAAMTCQGFCRSELALFARLLAPARVERSEHLLTGSRRCAYLVVTA
jgi:hypothetical protein